ncbi:putative MFS family arabinose efflux permease [Actinoplanes xinjiangensis]|uniref:Putative MFS family arabinose efflux permease n=1 Tax=Actinoplanes xinjiangensis TaxID=512350 RepID=A0A316E7W6_9ACTN|nr:putative MFS family arabinose efflux permease [Actinoplanes xinjiangensis]
MGYLQLLRKRSVLVLWSSAALSVLGDRLYGLAVMWVVYESTGSATWMGVAAVVESIPYILIGTFGRDLVARFSSYRALGWLDAGRAAAACALPLLWSPDGGGLAVLLAMVFVLGTLGALFGPNLGALVPDLVEPGQVRRVIGLLDLTTRIAAIAGPGAVGLILLAVSEVQLFALDGVTFAVSAVAMWWLHAHARRTARVAAASGTQAAVPVAGEPAPAAWPVLRRHPDVTLAVSLHGVGFFVAAVSAVGLPALLAVQLGQGAAGYGLALAAVGAGALAGNLLIGNLQLGHWLSVYCGAWMVAGLTLFGYGIAPSMPVVLAVGFIAGLATPAAAVTLRTRLSEFGKQERLRLMTVDQTVIRTAGTVGMLTLPMAVDAAPTTAFAGAGVLLLVTAAVTAVVGHRWATMPKFAAAEPVGGRVS